MNIRDMIAWFKLDETSGTIAEDSSGNGYHGTYVNSPTLNQNGAFGTSKAVAFASVSSQKMTSALTWDTIKTGAWTFASWIKVNAVADCVLIGSQTDGAVMIRTNPSAQIDFQAGGSTAGTNRLTGTTVLPVNTWRHVVVTYDNVSTAKIYINGVVDATDTTFTPTLEHVAGAIQLGARVSSAYLNGTLDDVRIYIRALTPDEVALLYAWSGDEHTDAWTHNKNDGNIPFSVGTLSIPNKSFAVFSNQGNIDLQQINNKFNRSDGQHFYKPPS